MAFIRQVFSIRPWDLIFNFFKQSDGAGTFAEMVEKLEKLTIRHAIKDRYENRYIAEYRSNILF